jgi:coenzyme PQQ precursor peptide PqqA
MHAESFSPSIPAQDQDSGKNRWCCSGQTSGCRVSRYDPKISGDKKIRLALRYANCHLSNVFNGRRNTMAWAKPVIREIECGMEINMYGPDFDDDREVLF